MRLVPYWLEKLTTLSANWVRLVEARAGGQKRFSILHLPDTPSGGRGGHGVLLGTGSSVVKRGKGCWVNVHASFSYAAAKILHH